jgi:hypothetical protein
MSVPSNPDWNRYSDVIRSFTANGGASYGAQESVGSPDAQDHFRGVEDPSLSIGYDLQQFFVDGSGNPVDAAGDAIVRDSENQLQNTHLAVERQTLPSSQGNDNAGVRIYTVGRGLTPTSATATLDPSTENPILAELEYQPRKVRSYRIHQPSAATTIDIVSTDSNDTMDITIENEDAGTTETISLNGTTTVTTTSSFGDIDAVWLSDNPAGDVTLTDGSGTTLMQIDGGISYSDDGNPVDGDRGVPALGTGSHASAIGSTYEHFVGDRFERPSGSDPRARVNSASWTVENDVTTSTQAGSRLPVVDVGNRTVTVDAEVQGPYVSHDSMREALTKVQQNIEHELDGGTVTFNNTVPESNAERSREPSQAVAGYSETFAASGDPPITLSSS